MCMIYHLHKTFPIFFFFFFFSKRNFRAKALVFQYLKRDLIIMNYIEGRGKNTCEKYFRQCIQYNVYDNISSNGEKILKP